MCTRSMLRQNTFRSSVSPRALICDRSNHTHSCQIDGTCEVRISAICKGQERGSVGRQHELSPVAATPRVSGAAVYTVSRKLH